MNLLSVYFDLPRSYPTGPLMGKLESKNFTVLKLENGAVYVQKEGRPLIGYALGPKDWWEPAVEADFRMVPGLTYEDPIPKTTVTVEGREFTVETMGGGAVIGFKGEPPTQYQADAAVKLAREQAVAAPAPPSVVDSLDVTMPAGAKPNSDSMLQNQYPPQAPKKNKKR